MSNTIVSQDMDFGNWFQEHVSNIKWHGDEGQGSCPLETHGGPDQHPSFSANRAKGTWFCHKEGIGGSIKELAERLGVKPPFKKQEKPRGKVRKKEITAVYPYLNVEGNVIFEVVRQQPKDFLQRRPNSDQPKKYIWNVKGIDTRIPYRLPEVTAAIAKGEIVFVTEGEKDCNNLAAMGLVGTTNAGGAGKWTEKHSEHFPAGAEIVILPDNDDAGRDHARKVANQLTARGCRVRVVELPGLREKGDVSDWLKDGGTKEELLELVGRAAYWEMQLELENKKGGLPTIYNEWRKLLGNTRYCLDNVGNLCHKKFMPDGGFEEIPICNFLAKAVKETTRDDGLEQKKSFRIAGVLAGGIPLPEIEVSAKDFSGMGWIAPGWGLCPNIEPGSGTKDRVRHAIQSIAYGIEKETVYTHLGWRKIGGKWAYLHSSGAIGTANIIIDVSESKLERYELPAQTGDLVEAIKISLNLLRVAPLEVSIPLFAYTYLAPLCEPLQLAGYEPSFLVWLFGESGSMKSTLAALFLCHFGKFSRTSLPASFRDTINALEKKAFLVKDSLLVIDDFHPVPNPMEAKKMAQTAQRLLRGYGDRVGKARMNSDLTSRAAYAPRGLGMITGEDTPDLGRSATARYLGVELKKSTIDIQLLSETQSNTEKLAQAMRGYIEWLAHELDELPEMLGKWFVSNRQKAVSENQHGRLPEIVAWLYLGFTMALNFAEQTGALEREEKNKMLAKSWNVLVGLGADQAVIIESEKPARKFLGILRELMQAGTIFLRNLHDARPVSEPGFLGWFDSEYCYLLPDLAYKTVQQFCIGQGGHFPVGQRMLWKELETENLLFVEQAKRYTTRITDASGRRLRVVKLAIESLQ
ncbi:MAG: hypothetical protein A4E53_01039 [Pelotomaculum sp. PtaB.Bin104]|nr:MAG: hypothetical protein A4E53_01039 [Pelotomaculum sp. PtaB.Bin104]